MDRTEIIRKLTELADSVMLAKGKDYTAGNWDTDPNYNFNAIAELLKGAPITPYTVCMIYFLKHVFSLIKYAKTGIQEGGERLEGRHVDALNYVRILWTLVGECAEEVPANATQEQVKQWRVELKATEDAEFVNLLNTEYFMDTAAVPCSCPSCRRTRKLSKQLAQDRLDRVNYKLNNNKQE